MLPYWESSSGAATSWSRCRSCQRDRSLAILAGALMGVGSGLWLALWLPHWWANSLVGAVVGCTYWLIATPMHTGMLPPTDAGVSEISQLHGLKESLTGPDPVEGWEGPDSMLAYAVALDAALPWLDASVPAPPWFASGEAASLRALDLNVAYHGFMSAPEWGLAGRSEGGGSGCCATRQGRAGTIPRADGLRPAGSRDGEPRNCWRNSASREPGGCSRTGADALSRRRGPAFAAKPRAPRQNH